LGNADERTLRIPILRVLGGIFFVLAGIFEYYGIGLSIAVPAVFVLAGMAVILVAFAGHSVTGGDIAVFVIGLLVLGAVAASLAVPMGESVSFSATTPQMGAHSIDVVASAGVGSVKLLFSNNSNLAYQVNFTRPITFFPFQPSAYSLNNRTIGNTLILNATSQFAEITITVGSKYPVDINATSGTGSITVRAPGGEVKRANLYAGTGSIDAIINSQAVTSIRLTAGTGSVSLDSSSLAPAGSGVPISISTGTGSIHVDVAIPRGDGVSLSAMASFGSLSHSLSGFTIAQDTSSMLKATGGNSSSSQSFAISLSAGTGSVNISARIV
jgi:hypothetical protein